MKRNSIINTKTKDSEEPTGFPKETESYIENDKTQNIEIKNFLSEEEEIQTLSVLERNRTLFYKAQAKKEKAITSLIQFCKWIFGIIVALIVGFGVYYLQNVAEPMGRVQQAIEDLKEQTKEDITEIKQENQRLEDEIKQIQKDLKP